MMLNDVDPEQLFQFPGKPEVYRLTGGERGKIGLGVLEIEAEPVGRFYNGHLKFVDPRILGPKKWFRAERKVKIVNNTTEVSS